jgi:hypothetical protein
LQGLENTVLFIVGCQTDGAEAPVELEVMLPHSVSGLCTLAWLYGVNERDCFGAQRIIDDICLTKFDHRFLTRLGADERGGRSSNESSRQDHAWRGGAVDMYPEYTMCPFGERDEEKKMSKKWMVIRF